MPWYITEEDETFLGSLIYMIVLLMCGLKMAIIQPGPVLIDTMMTSSNGNIFRVTGHLCGEFTGPGEFPTQRPVTQSFDVFFDLRLNKRLSKQRWGWWFETLSRPLWRHRNDGTLNKQVCPCSVSRQKCILILQYLFLLQVLMNTI